jgi:hypothetical protein
VSATWFLRLFCSGPEHESMVGDLLEQYQRGRGRFWYWRQVAGMVLLELACKARRISASTNRIAIGQGIAVILLIAALSAVLLSDIWLLGLLGILGGVVTAGLKFLRDSGRAEHTTSAAPGPARRQKEETPMTESAGYHPGISINHIPVEGGAGLLFALATVFIFGGILAVREIIVLTAPLGILGAGILFYWHKSHPMKIQALDLHESKHSHS